jgi:hypothetical protein
MEKIKALRFHAEEKGHWIVALGYFGSVITAGGHNAVMTGTAYALAAALATHHASRVRAVRKQDTDS